MYSIPGLIAVKKKRRKKNWAFFIKNFTMNALGAELHNQRMKRQRPKWTPLVIGNTNTTILISEQPGLHIGSITWEGSDILLRHLLQTFRDDLNSKIQFLELGAGTGVVGLGLLAALPHSQVTLTDKDISILSQNVERNNELANRAKVEVLVWGDEERIHTTTGRKELYDCIVASDVLYSAACVNPLFQTVSSLLQMETTTMYLCYKKRDEEAEAIFFQLLENDGICTTVVGKENEHIVFQLKRGLQDQKEVKERGIIEKKE